MHIIHAMTRVAVTRYVPVLLIDVATVTGNICMLVQKHIIRRVVIESLFLPATFIMTIRTGIPKTSFVSIIFLMAIHTALPGITIFFSGYMTRRTPGHGVNPLEFEICIVMIKCFSNHLDDVRITAQVFAMTIVAVGIPSLTQTMATLLLSDVRIDLFMAVPTQLILASLVE